MEFESELAEAFSLGVLLVSMRHVQGLSVDPSRGCLPTDTVTASKPQPALFAPLCTFCVFNAGLLNRRLLDAWSIA